MRKLALFFGTAVIAMPVVAFAQAGAARNPVTTSASPETTSLSPPVSNPQQTGDPMLDEVACRNEPPPTGTRVGGTRICKTNREWIEDEDAMNRARNNEDQTAQTVQTNMRHGGVNPGH